DRPASITHSRRTRRHTRFFKSNVPLCNHAFSLLNHLPDNSKIIQRLMNTRRHKTNTLSDLPVRILLRGTTKIPLHTLQIPPELLHSKQSRFRLLVLSQLKRLAQSTGLSQTALGDP